MRFIGYRLGNIMEKFIQQCPIHHGCKFMKKNVENNRPNEKIDRHYSVLLPQLLTCNQDKYICLMLALSDPLLLSCTLVPTCRED
jgi:hypothetical protein